MEVDHSALPSILEEEEKHHSAFNATSNPRKRPMESYLDHSQMSEAVMAEQEESSVRERDLSGLHFGWNI